MNFFQEEVIYKGSYIFFERFDRKVKSIESFISQNPKFEGLQNALEYNLANFMNT